MPAPSPAERATATPGLRLRPRSDTPFHRPGLRLRAAALAVGTGLLVSCGGGGGGGSTSVASDGGSAEPVGSGSVVSGVGGSSGTGTGSSTGSSSTSGSTSGTTASGGASTGTATGTTTGTTASPTDVSATSLAVLVAEGDPTSEAIARAYQAARGLSDSQIIRVALSTATETLGEAEFGLLKSRIDAQLGASTQALLVTWSQPSRVTGACTMSLTSALTFGYDNRWCGQCNRTQVSRYYGASTRRPWTDLGLRPSMMLGARTLAQAQALIARGLAAEGAQTRATAQPQATLPQGWLLRTSDSLRSVRWTDMQALSTGAAGGATAASRVRWRYQDNSAGATSDRLNGAADVMFYLTGLARVPDIGANTYLPGAVADHLTSFGGVLPSAYGQMPATDWLDAGLTGSYGTVEEPCNWTEKFPRASVLAQRYTAGDTLIEAYWKSVQWPGQGLFVGDPLARPWAPG
ncbi:MAG: hypothetical protein RLY78_156 [Pseudomonadota bacterium]